MIDPGKVCLFQPSELKDFKRNLFERIGNKIKAQGGRVCIGNVSQLQSLPADIIPIVGCSTYLKGTIDKWKERRRPFIYWDRGYFLRVFATWLPRGEAGGYYRWHRSAFQLQSIKDYPDDRLKRMNPPVKEWQTNGRHIVIAHPTPSYTKFHGIENWTANTIEALARLTDRQIVVRDKETKRPLQADLEGAHALVAHGSNAAVEAVICGCPVFVDPSSAASLVGKTSLSEIERPAYPDRDKWLRALSYSHFNETELVDGTLWRLLE